MSGDEPANGSATESRVVPRAAQVAGWLLYGNTAVLVIAAIWSILGLPWLLGDELPHRGAEVRFVYALLLLTPMALVFFFTARGVFKGRILARIVGTVLGFMLALAAFPFSVFGPPVDAGRSLSDTSASAWSPVMSTVWLFVGVAIIVLLWAPSTWGHFRRQPVQM